MFLARTNSKHLLNRGFLAYSTATTNPPEKCPFEGSSTANGEVKKLKFVDSADEFAKARPFSEMPGPSVCDLIKNTVMPSGKYYKAGLKQIHLKLQEEYGDVVKFPGMFGRETLVFLYDADSVEKVFRNEGQYPDRRSFEFIQTFREKYRPDLFKGNGGLLQE